MPARLGRNRVAGAEMSLGLVLSPTDFTESPFSTVELSSCVEWEDWEQGLSPLGPPCSSEASPRKINPRVTFSLLCSCYNRVPKVNSVTQRKSFSALIILWASVNNRAQALARVCLGRIAPQQEHTDLLSVLSVYQRRSRGSSAGMAI